MTVSRGNSHLNDPWPLLVSQEDKYVPDRLVCSSAHDNGFFSKEKWALLKAGAACAAAMAVTPCCIFESTGAFTNPGVAASPHPMPITTVSLGVGLKHWVLFKAPQVIPMCSQV